MKAREHHMGILRLFRISTLVVVIFIAVTLLKPESAETALFEMELSSDPASRTEQPQQNSPQSANDFYSRGLQRWRNRDVPGAIEDFTKAIKLDPKHWNAYFQRSLCWGATPQSDKAIADLGKVIKLNPSYYGAYLNRSNLFRNRRDFKKAMADLNSAIALQPDNPNGYQSRGILKWETGKSRDGLIDLDKSIQLGPNEGVRYMVRGFIWASLDEFSSAYGDFDRAFQLDPNLKNLRRADPIIIDHYTEHGAQLADSGDFNSAMAEFNKAIILAGQNTQSYSIQVQPNTKSLALAFGTRGLIWLQKGNEAEARKDFAECLRLDPSVRPWLEEKIRNSGRRFSSDNRVSPRDMAKPPAVLALSQKTTEFRNAMNATKLEPEPAQAQTTKTVPLDIPREAQTQIPAKNAAKEGFSTDWGKWGTSMWPPEFKPTPGLSLIFHQPKQDVLQYGLVTVGFPADKTYYLWQRKLNSQQPMRLALELGIKMVENNSGFVFNQADGKPLLIAFGTFLKGEAFQVALISEDKTIVAFAKTIPNPIEAIQGPYRLWVELGTPNATGFIIWGEGFEPDEEIDATSLSEGEVIKSKIKAGGAGRFMTIVGPAVIGKKSGSATYGVVGKSGEVKVSYQWGLPAEQAAAPNGSDKLLIPDKAELNHRAPSKFQIKFETSKGDFLMEIYRDWSPHGADRLYYLAQNGFYNNARFFRVIEGFMAQFGLHGDPNVTKAWRDLSIQDDPVKESNLRGYVSFAKSNLPDSRTTQLFINCRDNLGLDAQGFSPIGKVIQGMDVVDRLYSGYSDALSANQELIHKGGNEYLNKNFPDLDYIIKAQVIHSDQQ
jgi:peptidyl-prolyl cis-trans isomerase A (cyclophilin A)